MAAEALAETKAPFKSARHAIRWAHEIEATDLTRVAKSIADAGGGGFATDDDRLSPEEQHAQAAYVLLAVQSGVEPWALDMIRAEHMAPGSAERRERVERVAMRVAEALDRPGMPLDWAIEEAGAWFGDRAYTRKIDKHGRLVAWTTRDWAKHYGLPETTLSAWKRGGKRQDGIHTVLDDWQGEAEGHARRALRDALLIP